MELFSALFSLKCKSYSSSDYCYFLVTNSNITSSSPDDFDVSRLTNVAGGNWVLMANNIKQILRYYSSFTLISV